MARTNKFYRVRIRTAADDADDLVLTSIASGENPYIVDAPSGDGESIDPITGKPTTGSYSVRVADPETAANVRPVTAVLADVYARQQLIARKVYVETGEDDTFPDTMVVGYVTAIRLVTAITYEIAVGQSRRIENSREIFKTATIQFPATTSLIGGPILGGFGTLVDDLGGWTFRVTQVYDTAPKYRQIKIVNGFDPRKAFLGAPYNSFATTSNAITDYENNYARQYFEPFPATSLFVTAKDIQGHFPQMRVRLIPITNPGDPTREFVPLSEPDPSPGGWFHNLRVYDNLTSSGQSSLWLPRDCKDADSGDDLLFDPALNDQFEVYVYATPVSENNPLHIYMHPVDLWEKLMIEARIAYDATVLPALKTLIDATVDGDTRLALRITQSYKLTDFLQQVIYGPFRLSTRLVDGKQTLFSIRVRDASVVQTITPANLRQDETTLFDLDEGTVVTSVILKTNRLYLWSTAEAEQPTVDTILEGKPSSDSLENADDDIPGWDGASLQSPTLREVNVGDIPGQIVRDTLGPVDFDRFIADLGDEMFQRMGRGAIGCELACLPSVTAVVGDIVTLNLPRLPAALSSQTPVSQRGTPRDFQVVQRTEIPEGSNCKLIDASLVVDTEFMVVGPDVMVIGDALMVA